MKTIYNIGWFLWMALGCGILYFQPEVSNQQIAIVICMGIATLFAVEGMR
jgi:hypothetical protein